MFEKSGVASDGALVIFADLAKITDIESRDTER